jgi:peptide/nickel transport system substrate-binding protein
VFDGLFECDLDTRPISSLAESWDVNGESTSVTFHLRQGVMWHDGKPFTSDEFASRCLSS